MGKIDYVSELSLLGKVLGAIAAICTGLWFFGEPFLEDYVESHFEKHEEEVKTKIKFRTLLSNKMGVPEDETHIELGRMYQSEAEERQKLYDAIDSDFKYSKDKRNLIITEIKYLHPGTTLRLE